LNQDLGRANGGVDAHGSSGLDEGGPDGTLKPDATAEPGGGFVHDLNNLLAVIKNYAAFLSQDVRAAFTADGETSARLMEDVEQIVVAADRAIRLTERVPASVAVMDEAVLLAAAGLARESGGLQPGPLGLRVSGGGASSMSRELSAAVLIVDDDEGTRRTLVRILESRSVNGRRCRCTAVSSAVEARRALRVSEWDLMLCDVVMPGQTGLSLLRHIKSSASSVPVVMVSGVDSPAIAQTASESGACGYIVKPFSDSQVRIAVASALRRADLERENQSSRDRLQVMQAERAGKVAGAGAAGR